MLTPLLVPVNFSHWTPRHPQVRTVADDHALASLLLSRFTFLRRPGLHVVHIASEMVPVAKVGGLGDVVTGLAKAHQQR